MLTVVLVSVVFLAFVNGANDNFKGVATLYGSRTASYRTSLAWATVTTAIGAMLAPVIAPGLIGMFKAKGLVPDAIAASPEFMTSAVLAAAATVAVATRIGMPVSTTHALTGGLVGAGLIAAGSELNLQILARSFVLPLLAGPFVAAALAAAAAVVMKLARRTRTAPDIRLDAEGKGLTQLDDVQPPPEGEIRSAVPGAAGTAGGSVEGNGDGPLQVPADRVFNVFHFVSAGAASFARGVNDAPKIVALGLAAGVLGGSHVISVMVVALSMAVGGILMSRRIAKTMSHISTLDPGTGVVANTTAAVLVILGSVFKLPLSTTHVTTGAIVGVGMTRRRVAWGLFGKIATAWVTTLPVAIVFGAVLYLLCSLLFSQVA